MNPEAVTTKVKANQTKLTSVGNIAAVIAAVYFLGKSRGKIVIFTAVENGETIHSVHKQ